MGIWVFDDVFKASGTRPGEQWDGRTNAPRLRVFTGKRSPEDKMHRPRCGNFHSDEDEIFPYFRHETLKIASSLVLRNAHVLVFPVSCFRVENHGISTWGRSGDVFFLLFPPQKVRKPVAVAVQENARFFFFRGSEIKVKSHCHLDARRPRSHTHTPDRSIDRVDDTHSDERERERERKSEARAPPVWTL